ncbi:MAG: lytic transglycosylase domain-containing protein [Alphaproteobacteria bacterium]|nr:lytic transglycosylase domain-containing protein [Alphaproteobacteria bacterium]
MVYWYRPMLEIVKELIGNRIHLSSAHIAALGFLCVLGLFSLCWPSDASLPVPPRKPAHYADGSISRVPMAGKDAALYKDIFTLQRAGDMAAADAKISQLADRRLLGHVLYQRYMHPSHKTTFTELKTWMDSYAAQPGADRIYRMALARMPENYTGQIRKPSSAGKMAGTGDILVAAAKIYQPSLKRNAREQAGAEKFKETILSLIADGKNETALKKLGEDPQAKKLDKVEYDQLRARISEAYLYQGKADTAFMLANAGVKRSGSHVPTAAWVAGLTAWREGRYSDAARYFEVPARSPYASGWLSAAGSYWAARSHMRAGNVRAVSLWLERAAQQPRTFYGLLATRALGKDFDFNWQVPTFTRKYYDLLMATPEGNRAISLVETGQRRQAEIELSRMNPRKKDLREAVLAYAAYAGLPALSMRMGNEVSGQGGLLYDAALYPMVPWEPEDGYKIDPALINAIARQESKFDPAAVSASGALGLMQLMPGTASSVSRKLRGSDLDREYRLKDPETNLEVGQQYLQDLLEDRRVGGDILKLLVAYNAGPGNLGRWQRQWADVDDPLLFIELIPSGQTRSYVERVLANYWIYRLRAKLPTPTMDALAQGRPAQYAGDFEGGEFAIASR